MYKINLQLQRGKDNGIHIMIDAEQTYIQAALGYMVLLMQAVYNKDECIVFNTYQCYRVRKYFYHRIGTD